MAFQKEQSKTIILTTLGVLVLAVMFWRAYTHEGPAQSMEPVYSFENILIMVFLWICYKVYELNMRIGNLESRLDEYSKREALPNSVNSDMDLQKMLAEGKDITEAVKKMNHVK